MMKRFLLIEQYNFKADIRDPKGLRTTAIKCYFKKDQKKYEPSNQDLRETLPFAG